MKKVFISSNETGLPFSEAIEVNGFLYISGQIHCNENGDLIGTTIQEKTHITMTNIARVLTIAGYTFADLIKIEIFLPDLTHRKEVSEIYESYLSHPFPVRTMIGVTELPQSADIEITAVAYKK